MKFEWDEVDMQRMRLFLLELRLLADHMRRNNHPDAERLEHLMTRFVAPADADRLRPHG